MAVPAVRGSRGGSSLHNPTRSLSWLALARGPSSAPVMRWLCRQDGNPSEEPVFAGGKGSSVRMAEQGIASRIKTRWLGASAGSPCDVSALGGRGRWFLSLPSHKQSSEQCVSVIRCVPTVMCAFRGSFAVCFGAG